MSESAQPLQPLSARSGEREGPAAQRREGEVSLRGTNSPCIDAHLTRAPSLRSGRTLLYLFLPPPWI